ncbi:RrF2 family transcriptional regulator [Holophaga foetida]|uniref:RrF2 family transcriptional regulator n=1 Tax=Holophaga foetida TaxID=35839 RepID=UPI0002473796|nr:RrF2 family transcriptional regulator [Holophaga foetida]
MKMSTKGRYGLRVMLELALNYRQGPVLVDAIALNQGISGKYIHVLVGALKTASLIKAVRGPNGGYELTRDPATISILEIIQAMEGDIAPLDCIRDASCCNRVDSCASREIWCEVAAAMTKVLAGRTLADLAQRQQGKEKGSPDFCI